MRKRPLATELHRELHSERGTRSEGRRPPRSAPAARGTPEHSKQPSPQDSLRQREIEDLAQRLPRWYRKPISAKQYRLMRELFLRFELFGVIDERNGLKVCRLQKRPAHFF